MNGASARRARAERADLLVRTTFAEAVTGRPGDFAVVATGGYGRRSLSPFSDLDLLIVSAEQVETQRAGEVARALVVPLRDDGWRVDHAVRSVRRTAELLRSTPISALALVSGRYLAGDESLAGSVIDVAHERLADQAHAILADLEEERERRARRFGRVTDASEPHLKDSAGGLRDGAIAWSFARVRGDRDALAEATTALDALSDVRDALHEVSGWRTDRLSHARRPAVADRLGVSGDELSERLGVVGAALEALHPHP